MKKITVLWVMLFVMAFGTMANPVDVNRARRVASAFLTAKYHRTVDDLKVVETPYSSFYVFNAPSGFVMVAADDCVSPILGYSLTRTFKVEGMPSNLRGWLDGCESTIARLKGEKTDGEKQGSAAGHMSKAVVTEWQQLLGGVAPQPLLTTTVSPLLTTTWNQSPLYNDMCPYDSTYEQHVVTGCVATATAQIMKYWNHPTTGYGSHSYYAQNSHISYGVLSANFGNTTYNWSIMPTALTSASSQTEIDAVAQLMYHVGVAIEMNYNVSFEGGSGAYNHSSYNPSSMSALVDYFKYAPDIVVVRPGCYDAATYSAMLRAELDQQRPILYDGRDPDGGHSFVCDGYDDNNMFHFNWGWGGYCDGYYALGALNPAPGGTGGNSTYTFNLSNSAMLGIRPNANFGTGGTVTVNTTGGTAGCSVSGAGTYNFGDTVTLVVTAAEGYRFGGWTDNSQENPRVFTMTGGNYSFTARFETIGGDTMSYCGNMAHESYWGEYDQGFDKYWGIKLPAASLGTGRTLSAVEFYVGSSYYAGTFDMTVYSGTTAPTDTVYSTTVTTGSSDINSWYSIFLPTPYTVEAGKSIWITFHNNDILFPATVTASCGNPDGFLYGAAFAPDPEWTRFSFMIRGRFDNPGVVVDGDTISYCGDKGYQTSWAVEEWGIMLPAAELQGRNYLKSVKMFADFDGIFTLHVYKGGATAPGTQVHSQPARIEGYGWHEIVLDSTVAINAGDSLWITLENHELTWPATSCRYTGNTNSNWFTRNGEGWNHLDNYFGDGNFSWMIKAVTSATAPVLPPPTVVVSGESHAGVGETVTFTAAHSVGTTVTWAIQGGTPATASGDTVAVSWNRCGFYRVSATVSNANGSTTDSLMVSVADCDSISLPYTADFTQCWTADGGAVITDSAHAYITSQGQTLTSPWLMTQPGLTFIGMILSRTNGEQWNANARYSMRVEDENGGLLYGFEDDVRPTFSNPSFYSNGGRVRVVFEYTGSVAVSSFYIESLVMYQYDISLAMDLPPVATVGDTVTLRLSSYLQNNDTCDYVSAWMYDTPNYSNYRRLYPYPDANDSTITVVAQSDNCLSVVWHRSGNYEIGASVSKYYVYDGWLAQANCYEVISVLANPVYFEDSIYYTSAAKDTVIGSHRQLHNAVLPASVRVVKDSAFFNRGYLASLSLPEGLEHIGKMAFACDYALTEVTIPQGVKVIGDNAFWNCSALTTVNFNADSCVAVSPTTASDGSYWPAFIDCYSLTTVNIGENVKRIPDRTFWGCYNLRGTLVIPDTVTYIGYDAFTGWNQNWVGGADTLAIVLGSSVAEIGEYAFGMAFGKLRSVVSRNPVPPSIQGHTFYVQQDVATLTVPCGTIPAYMASPYWNDFVLVYDDCSGIDEVDAADTPRIYSVEHGIVVEGAVGEQVRVYDVMGRTVATTLCGGGVISVPQTGVYMVAVGERQACKVVVLK